MECKLSELNTDMVGEILSVTLRGPMRRRLQDLGFLPGVRVYVRLGGSGIRAYGIHGSVIALRRCDAAGIQVKV